MDKLYINDTHFAHSFSSTDTKPEEFEWVRNEIGDYIVLTDNSLHMVNNYHGIKVFGWLIESPLITPSAYKFAKENYEKFEKIFTFDKELLKLSDKFELVPIGGCWIQDRNIHKKNKLISIIASNKKMTLGQRLRHGIIANYKMDVFGRGYFPIENKIEGLKNHMFSVTIENCQKDFYFTEKLIDCFMSGTVPIYWGCDSIGDFFNTDGMLLFNNMNEFDIIYDDISKDMYYSMLPAIKENFELAKNFVMADNIIYGKLKEIID
jgi:hypothetical protein